MSVSPPTNLIQTISGVKNGNVFCISLEAEEGKRNEAVESSGRGEVKPAFRHDKAKKTRAALQNTFASHPRPKARIFELATAQGADAIQDFVFSFREVLLQPGFEEALNSNGSVRHIAGPLSPA